MWWHQPSWAPPARLLPEGRPAKRCPEIAINLGSGENLSTTSILDTAVYFGADSESFGCRRRCGCILDSRKGGHCGEERACFA